MELRVFPTHQVALAAFDAERGRAHDFRRLEVLKGDGKRVKFVSAESLRNSEVLTGLRFDSIWLHPDVPHPRRRFFMALVKENGPESQA